MVMSSTNQLGEVNMFKYLKSYLNNNSDTKDYNIHNVKHVAGLCRTRQNSIKG